MYIKHKKAQAAMEFLMTYGWAILIVLIVLAALFFLGVFSPKTANVCQISTPFFCQDVVADDNSLGIKIKAQGVSSATVTSININGQDCNSFNTNLDINGDFFGCIVTLNKGDKFTVKYTLDYTRQLGISHKIIGESSGNVENSRKSKILVIENTNNGGSGWISKLTSFGHNVIIDTNVATKAQVDSYSPDIIACFNTYWGCSKSALFKQLYDSGYSVWTEGNDNYNAIYLITTTVDTSINVPTIYPDTITNHPLITGWTSASGSGGDGRSGITGIRSGAYSIIKDTTNNYYEGIYLDEIGKGKWYHHQSLGLPPDRLLKNIVSVLSLH